MTRTVFDTDMVAHIWAQGTQEEGRNSARRVFFEGPCLYSYGRHFLMAYRCPDLSAFCNSDSYSVSTSCHQSAARSSVRGRVYHAPNLARLAELLHDRIFRRAFWIGPNGQELDSPYTESGEYIGGNGREYREAKGPELKQARKALFDFFLKSKESTPVESMRAAFEYAGANEKESAALSARIVAAHEKRAKEEKAAALKAANSAAIQDARAAAARPLSDFEAAISRARDSIRESNWRGKWEGESKEILVKASRLLKARKAAKAKGWTRLCADLLARERLLRQGAAGLESFSFQVARRANWGEYKKAWREALAALKPGGPALSGYDWQKKRQAVESLLDLAQVASLTGSDHWLYRPARIAGASLPRMAAGLEAGLDAIRGAESRAYAGQARQARKEEVKTLRAYKAAGAGLSADLATATEKVAGRYAHVTYGSGIAPYRPKIPAAYSLAGFTGEAFAAIRAAAKERAAALKLEAEKAKVQAWREGGQGGRYSDPKGGALLRAVQVERDSAGAIIGGRLDTSHGAQVPLTHALKAFRFLKLCKEAGKAWRANGKSLQVGHFRVDSIDTEGNFIAGCHKINWGEVAALAARLGVESLAPADTTDSSHA